MPDAVRFLFSCNADGSVSLLHSYRVDMFIPANCSLPNAPMHHLVVKDSEGSELYRVGVPGAFPTHMRVHPKKGEGPPWMVRVTSHGGVCQAIVPYHDNMDHVSLTRVELVGPVVESEIFRALLKPEMREIEIARFPAVL